MNSKDPLEQSHPGDTFEEKIDILIYEIDLAIKWERPSILFAIYNSGSTLSKAKARLESRLAELDKKACIIEISGKKQSNFPADIFQLPQSPQTVLFIDDIKWDRDQENPSLFKELNRHLEKFVDNRIRVVFWLSGQDVPDFATNATECWILRHRVVEFPNASEQPDPLVKTLENAWQELDENILEDLPAGLPLAGILKSQEMLKPSYQHGHLILMLGILQWRKGNSQDAVQFLNTALEIARKVSHPTLETQCTDALALIQADIQKAASKTTPSKEITAVEQSVLPPEKSITVMDPEQKGVDMNESEHVFDYKTSAEWNALGNQSLKAGSYNEAISAFTRAIELAPTLSWPYIRNLAAAHYHKGRNKSRLLPETPGEADVWDGDDDLEPIVTFSQDQIPAAQPADEDPQGQGSERGKEAPAGSFATQQTLSIPHPSGSTGSDLPSDPLQAEGEEKVQTPSPDNHPVDAAAPVDADGPKSAFEWNESGNFLANAHQYEQAIAAYKRSIELDPGFGQPYSNLGFLLYHSGKYQSAVLLLHRSLDLLDNSRDKATSWNRLGDVYRRMRDYGNALDAYQRANQLNPDPNPLLNRSRLSLMNNVAVG